MRRLTWLFFAVTAAFFALEEYSCLVMTDESKNFDPENQSLDLEKFKEIIDAVNSKEIKIVEGDRTYVITKTVLGRGSHGIIFKGQIEVKGKSEPHDVAVKMNKKDREQIRIESLAYKRLGAFTPNSFEESKECIPKVYYFKWDYEIAGIKVDIMVMQRLGRSISRHVFARDKFSIREMLMAGKSLTKCLRFIHKRKVIVNHFNLKHVLTRKKADDFRLFIVDFGGATGPDMPNHISTFSPEYASPRICRLALEKKNPVSPLRIDDFYSLLVSLLIMADQGFLERWFISKETETRARLKAIKKLREQYPLATFCKREPSGTLTTFWKAIENELSSDTVPKDNIEAAFEDGFKYLRETPDDKSCYKWLQHSSLPEIPTKREEIIPIVRLSNVINDNLPPKLKPLYDEVISTNDLIIKNDFKLLPEVIDWGTSSLVFLGQFVKTGVYVAIKVQQKPAGSDLSKLNNQYNVLKDLASSEYVPDIFAFEDNLALGAPAERNATGKSKRPNQTIAAQALVMELLGPTLETLLKSYTFSLRTIDILSLQVLTIMESVHDEVVFNQLTPRNLYTKLDGHSIKINAFSYASNKRDSVPFPIEPSAYTPNQVLMKMTGRDKKFKSSPIDDLRWYSHCLLGFINRLPPKDIIGRIGDKDPRKLCQSDKSDVICKFYKQAMDSNTKRKDLVDIIAKNFKAIREVQAFVYEWSGKPAAPTGFEYFKPAKVITE